MRGKKAILAAVLATTVVTANAAISEISRGGVSGTISTLGLGAEYVYQHSDEITFRGGYHVASFGSDGANKFEINNISLLADYHFAGGYLRATGGLINMDGKLTVANTGDATTHTYEGFDFQASDIGTIKPEITFGGTLPYIGLGLAKKPSTNGIGFSLDAGLATNLDFKPSFEVTCKVPGSVACDLIKAEEKKVNLALEKEDIGKAAYPVLSAGVSYSF